MAAPAQLSFFSAGTMSLVATCWSCASLILKLFGTCTAYARPPVATASSIWLVPRSDACQVCAAQSVAALGLSNVSTYTTHRSMLSSADSWSSAACTSLRSDPDSTPDWSVIWFGSRNGGSADTGADPPSPTIVTTASAPAARFSPRAMRMFDPSQPRCRRSTGPP